MCTKAEKTVDEVVKYLALDCGLHQIARGIRLPVALDCRWLALLVASDRWWPRVAGGIVALVASERSGI